MTATLTTLYEVSDASNHIVQTTMDRQRALKTLADLLDSVGAAAIVGREASVDEIAIVRPGLHIGTEHEQESYHGP